MSANNFGDSMESGRGRSSSSRKGQRAGNSRPDRPRQPQRGLGVAQLEKMRLQSEMANYMNQPLGQPPPIHRTGSLNSEDARSFNSQSSSPSSSFHANINVSSPYPIHPNLMMEYGRRGDIRYGEFQSTHPIIRSPPNYHGAVHYPAHPNSDATLPLFEPEESICLKRHHDLNQSAGSSPNSDDPQDVDLELKL